MQTDDLLQTLGYADSPRFLRPAAFGSAPEFAHVFERAARQWNVRGVYLLRRDSSDENATSTPVIYVAEAESERAADAIHHAVWNQNVVPFLLVRLPGGVRLYSGFSCRSLHRVPTGAPAWKARVLGSALPDTFHSMHVRARHGLVDVFHTLFRCY